MAILQFVRKDGAFAVRRFDPEVPGVAREFCSGSAPDRMPLSPLLEAESVPEIFYDEGYFQEGQEIEARQSAKLAEKLSAEGAAQAFREANGVALNTGETSTDSGGNSLPKSDNVASLADFRAKRGSQPR